MEAKRLGPDTNHAPAVEQDDGDGDGVEHGLCAEAVAALDPPEGVDADGLGGDALDEQVRQRERVVLHDGILQRADDGDGRVERVAEQKVADEVVEALAQTPDVLCGAPQLPQAGEHDVGARVEPGPAPLEREPGQAEQQPDARGEGDEHAEAVVVVGHAGVDVQREQDADDDGQDDHLADALHVEADVAQLAALERVGVRVLGCGAAPRGQVVGALAQRARVARQPRERGRPEGQRRLVRDEADDVEAQPGEPAVRRVHAHPAEADAVGDARQRHEDPGPPGAKVGKRAQHEEHDDLDRKRDAVGQQHNRVDAALPPGKVQRRAVAPGLVHEVLELRRLFCRTVSRWALMPAAGQVRPERAGVRASAERAEDVLRN